MTAVRDAFPDAGLGDAPAPLDGFLPPVSLAYVDDDGRARPILDALDETAAAAATLEIPNASLIIIDRDNRMYQWRQHATAPLGTARERAVTPTH